MTDACLERGWELLTHNWEQGELLTSFAHQPEKERDIILRSLDQFEKYTGRKSKGWLSSSLRGTMQTADILAEYGCKFYCDIMNDDQPYLLKTPNGPIVSVPYSNEINDFTFITRKNFTTDQFRDALIEELDVLYAEGAKTGRIMNVGLHPHVSGRAHRVRALREFIEHAKSLPGVWWGTREEIAEWRCKVSKPQTILIVGGGVAGMTASAALAQQGFKVTLLESAPQFGEIGAGLTLTPNAMKGLDFIGICEEAAAVAVEPTRQRIQHWQDGRTLVALDRSTQREKYGAPYITVHRADLHGVMTSAAQRAGVEMIAGAQVVSSEGTTVTLADGRQFSADVLVGADGVKSVIRQRFGDDAPHFTGHVAWRCLVPVTPEIQDLSDFPGIIIGPGAMMNRYNVRGSKVMNFVFFARQEGWNQEGWTTPADPEELQAIYGHWCEDAQRLLKAAFAQPLFKWAINARKP
ncbi:hypothetical protein E4T56_gene4777, partial [Termitomyces sp. T112]